MQNECKGCAGRDTIIASLAEELDTARRAKGETGAEQIDRLFGSQLRRLASHADAAMEFMADGDEIDMDEMVDGIKI